MTLAEKVKYHRETLGLTQLQLAVKADVANMTVSFIESGRNKKLRRSTRIKLAKVLGIKEEILIP